MLGWISAAPLRRPGPCFWIAESFHQTFVQYKAGGESRERKDPWYSQLPVAVEMDSKFPRVYRREYFHMAQAFACWRETPRHHIFNPRIKCQSGAWSFRSLINLKSLHLDCSPLARVPLWVRAMSMMVCGILFIGAVEPLVDGANKHLPAVAANSGFRVNNIVAPKNSHVRTRGFRTH